MQKQLARSQPAWIQVGKIAAGRLAMLGGRVARATRMSWFLSRLPGRLGFAMAMLESTRSPLRRARYRPTSDGARHEGTTTLLTGCVMEGLFAGTNRATERTLRRGR